MSFSKSGTPRSKAKSNQSEKTRHQTVKIRVALAQTNSTVGDFAQNVETIRSMIQKAKTEYADLVLFPELALTGYPPEDLLLKREFIDENIHSLKSLVASAKGIVAVVGYVDRDSTGIYNAAALLAQGRMMASYRKAELPNYGVFDEKRYFQAGGTPLWFVLNGLTFCVSICEDIWVDNSPVLQSGKVADVLVNISSSPYYKGKRSKRELLVKKRAKECGVFVAYANLVGGQDELVFDGGGLMVSPAGKTLARGKAFEEDLIVVDLETIPKQKNEFLKKSFSPGKVVCLPPTNRQSKTPLTKRKVIRLNATEEIFEALKLGTVDYIRKNGFKKTLIGLSGGIDSALTAVVATEALGPGNVIGVLMPSPYSSRHSVKDALGLAKNLGIQTFVLPIESAMRAYSEILAKNAIPQRKQGKFIKGLTGENIQARIRGNLLMALSNEYGWLVLATGNKSEISVGYCTLYGDMAGGFAVIKDVPKTWVYKLSRFFNEKAGKEIIPKTVIDKPPSAELRPCQKDTDSLPEYDLLDCVLNEYVENDKSAKEMQRKGFSDEIVSRTTHLVDVNEYKRRQAPPGVKITPKSFGKDRRLPITSRFRSKALD